MLPYTSPILKVYCPDHVSELSLREETVIILRYFYPHFDPALVGDLSSYCSHSFSNLSDSCSLLQITYLEIMLLRIILHFLLREESLPFRRDMFKKYPFGREDMRNKKRRDLAHHTLTFHASILLIPSTQEYIILNPSTYRASHLIYWHSLSLLAVSFAEEYSFLLLLS